jgi:hypothetical protein
MCNSTISSHPRGEIREEFKESLKILDLPSNTFVILTDGHVVKSDTEHRQIIYININCDGRQ